MVLFVPRISKLHRAHWWEPYSSRRAGVGMSVPRRADCTSIYDVKDAKISSYTVYGLDAEQFLPLTVSFELKDGRYLIVERAVHEMGKDTKYYDPKTMKEVDMPSGHPYLVIDVSNERCDPREETPFEKCEVSEQREDFIDTIKEFWLGGNDTLAVGFLPGELMVILESDRLIRTRNLLLRENALEREVGKEDAARFKQLQVLEFKLYKYDKEVFEKWKRR